jgi:hypothetical protein
MAEESDFLAPFEPLSASYIADPMEGRELCQA